MKLRLNITFRLLFCFLVFAGISSSAQDTSTTTIRVSTGKKTVIKKNKTYKIDLENQLKFIAADSAIFSKPEYNDSHWQWMYNDSTDTLYHYMGSMWFRGELKDTGIFNKKPIALSFSTTGAAEIFLNGRLLKRYGTIGKDATSTIPSASFMDDVIPLQLDSSHNFLAIHFHGVLQKENRVVHLSDNDEMDIELGLTEELLKEKENTRDNVRIPIFFSGVFIVLSVFHFILFFYYRKNRSNLYYAFFTFLLFVVFYSLIRIFDGTDVFSLESISQIMLVTIFLIPLLFLGILYEVFYKKMIKPFYWFLGIFIIAIAGALIFEVSWAIVILIFYLFGLFAESIRVFIKAYSNKKDGALIFIFGITLPLLGVVVMLIIGSILKNNGYVALGEKIQESQPAFFGYGMLMSMSLSMTVYLARDFARINRKLYNQITEIQSLLAKTIIQENDKKRILETQKADLERMVKERTEVVEMQKTELELRNRDILDNLIYAKRIQDAILPDQRLITQSLPESFIIYYPKDIVSGDFYTFAQQHGKIILAAADCTGHGVTGAFMSMIGSSLLNQIVNERRIIRPDLILNQLNAGIIESLKQSNSEINDGMDIAMCVFDLENKQLQYAGANRPLWIVRNNQLIEIKANKFPIGGLQHKTDAVFSSHEIDLVKNDSIYIFTDGYADQFGGPDGKKLLSKRFREKLLSIQHLSMQAQSEMLKEFFNDWKGHYPQVDDVLVIGVRI